MDKSLHRWQLTAVTLALTAIVSAARAQTNVQNVCTQSFIGARTLQDNVCALGSPWCVTRYTTSGNTNRCALCDPKVTTVTTGAELACNCDATSSYCSVSAQIGSETAGLCIPYTRLNYVCSQDSDCFTSATSGEYGGIERVDQRLFCVLSACKPCSPTAWAAQYGSVDAPFVCAGYDATLSAQLNRYATSTSRPGTVITCSASGDLITINSTVDFNYMYPEGDRTLWTPPPSATPSPSTLASGASPSRTPSAVATMSRSVGAQNNNSSSNAYRYAPVTFLAGCAMLAAVL